MRNEPVAMWEIPRLAEQARKRAATLDVKYELAVPPGNGPLGFGLAVGIPEGTKGIHVARLQVMDIKTRHAANAERAFFVQE